ncbi:MAG: hypothetical protein ACOYIP_04165 [Coriobacteriales bacterium]|jgi:hypothetical protein
MLCPDCGMQLLDEESVCPSCGKPVIPDDEMWVEFHGAPPKGHVGASGNDAGPDSTQMIGSEDPTMVRVPAGDAPAEGTEVLVFGGEYIFDDPDETGRLGSNDPTAVRGAAREAALAEPAHVMPSKQGIIDLTPDEVIHAVESAEVGEVAEPAALAETVDAALDAIGSGSPATEPVDAPVPAEPPAADAVTPDEPPAEPAPAVEPAVAAEDATELLGSEFPTAAKPAHDGAGSDPDKNMRMDIDPLASSGALDALGSLYDTGGMEFPIEGMEDNRKRSAGKELHGARDGEGESFGRRRRKGIIALVIVIVAAVIAAGVYMFVVVWPAHAVSDDEVRQTLLHDTEFMAGRASDMYVAEESYDLKNLNIDERTADEDGLKIEATALLENRFFSESDHVILVYPDTDNAEDYTLEVASHDVRAVRGISQDAEYGIYDANPTFDQASQTCSLEQKRAEASGNRWWFTESGEIKLAYEFSNDAWKRTVADTSNLTSSFQHIVGSYGMDDSRLKSFTIRSVDNETGSFKGTFTWEKEGSGLFGSREMEGSFSGTVHRDGTVEAAVGDAPGTMAFTGSFGDGESLTISGTVYLDSALSTLGFTDAPTMEFKNVTLTKGDEAEPVEPAADAQQDDAAGQQAQDAADSTGGDASDDSQYGSDGAIEGEATDGGLEDGSDGGATNGPDGQSTIEPEAGFDNAPSFENAPWSPFNGHRSIFNREGSAF